MDCNVYGFALLLIAMVYLSVSSLIIYKVRNAGNGWRSSITFGFFWMFIIGAGFISGTASVKSDKADDSQSEER